MRDYYGPTPKLHLLHLALFETLSKGLLVEEQGSTRAARYKGNVRCESGVSKIET